MHKGKDYTIKTHCSGLLNTIQNNWSSRFEDWSKVVQTNKIILCYARYWSVLCENTFMAIM